MISPHEREMLLAFLTAHADGDVLIQAANRVATNLEDVPSLEKFITAYKPKAPVPVSNVDRGNACDTPTPPGNPEDLGPASKKLGVNGQDIQALMNKRPIEWSVDGLKRELKISEAKIKPMLALLIERKMIRRATNFTYVTEKSV